MYGQFHSLLQHARTHTHARRHWYTHYHQEGSQLWGEARHREPSSVVTRDWDGAGCRGEGEISKDAHAHNLYLILLWRTKKYNIGKQLYSNLRTSLTVWLQNACAGDIPGWEDSTCTSKAAAKPGTRPALRTPAEEALQLELVLGSKWPARCTPRKAVQSDGAQHSQKQNRQK